VSGLFHDGRGVFRHVTGDFRGVTGLLRDAPEVFRLAPGQLRLVTALLRHEKVGRRDVLNEAAEPRGAPETAGGWGFRSAQLLPGALINEPSVFIDALNPRNRRFTSGGGWSSSRSGSLGRRYTRGPERTRGRVCWHVPLERWRLLEVSDWVVGEIRLEPRHSEPGSSAHSSKKLACPSIATALRRAEEGSERAPAARNSVIEMVWPEQI
jgi:hypothetical protein